MTEKTAQKEPGKKPVPSKKPKPQQEVVVQIPLSELHPFPDHPFQVREDASMQETAESVKEYGVLVPALARPREDGGYELIAGHRRKHACELAGLATMPVIVRDIDRDAATIIMVDSNLQRENILPSERAKAYKMKMEAIKRQGARTDLTSPKISAKFRSDDEVGQDAGVSGDTIRNYIALTQLVPELQQMVDEKKIALSPAYQLAALTPKEQGLLLETIDSEQTTPSLSQAQRMKKLSQSGELNEDTMLSIMMEQKKPEKNDITLSGEKLRKYFPRSYTPFQMLSTLVLAVFMFVLDWRLGLIAVIITLLASLVAKYMNKVSFKEAVGRQNQSENLTDAVLSFAEGIGVIKSYNLLGEKSDELTENFKKSRDVNTKFEQKMTPWTTGLNILYGVGIAAIFGLSVLLHQEGVLSLAYLLGVLLFVFDLFGPLKALYGEATRLTVMNAALDRIEAVLDEPELPDNGNQHILSQAQPDQPEVQFSDVGFAYQDKEVLHNISFSMQKNTMTALVGPSGGGKSTIANLLARLWDVKSGKVTIRGTDIRDVPLAELMEQISMVFQRVYLFQDTIYNNISMGKPDATEEEVYEAAKKARCYDFIMALPDGFQTVIGEGGATLSGGEKQRISIARCILKDAPIVILDEATASVDTDNESYIQEAINELVKGKTLLVIAHRLNTIRQADQILVISDGRISEQGTHDELMAKAGIYQDFINIRKKASGWSLA